MRLPHQSPHHNKEKYLKLLQVGFRVINQGETSGLPTTKLSAETKCLDSLLGSFVERCKTGADFIFGEIGFGGVEDVDDKLFAVEETVCDEFAGAESGTFVRLTVSISTGRRTRVSSGGGMVEFFKIFDPRNSSMHPSPTPLQRTPKGLEKTLTGRQRTDSEIGGEGREFTMMFDEANFFLVDHDSDCRKLSDDGNT